MKKTLLVILLIVLALGALAGAGFAGYQFGYARGAVQSEGRADTIFGRHDRFLDPKNVPGFGFFQRGRDPHHDFGPGFSRIDRGWGSGVFSPLSLLFRLAILGLIVWVVYMLFQGNGWQLTLSRVSAQTLPMESVESPTTKKSGRGKQ
jgi:hypothetical protein